MVGIGIVLAVILVGWYLLYSASPGGTGEKGKMYISFSDASADLQNVNDIALTVNKVELHSATRGWVTVSSSPKTVNLLTLKANGRAELAASADVAADTYDQVRANISSVNVKTKSGTKAAVLASRTFTAPARTVVRANETSHVDLDVQASDSLHTTVDGEYVFATVINVKSRSGTNVTVSSDNSVTASGGTQDSNITVGTDISGETRINAKLAPNVQIEIKGGVPVIINASGSAAGAGSGLINIQTGGSVNVTGEASGGASMESGGGTGESVIEVGGSGSGGVQVY